MNKNTANSELFLAVKKGSTSRIKRKVKQGVSLSAQDKQGNTVLHLAVQSSNLKVVECLLSQGASLSAQNKQGSTALHLAVQSQNLKIIRCLLQGISINMPSHKALILFRVTLLAQDEQGNTALHLAVESENLEIVRYLLSQGSSIDTLNNISLTPLQLAMVNESASKILDLLLSFQKTSSGYRSHLLWAAYNGCCNAVEYFLKNKLVKSSFALDDNGNTCLHLAAFNGKATVNKLLEIAPSLIDQRNYQGSTALHLAALGGYVSTVRVLIDAGSLINAKNKGMSTPLHYAVQQGNTGVAQLLIKGNANTLAEDCNGQTPLQLAQNQLTLLNESNSRHLNNSFEKLIKMLRGAAQYDVSDSKNSEPLLLRNNWKELLNKRKARLQNIPSAKKIALLEFSQLNSALTSFSTRPSRSQTVAESPCCYSTPALPTMLDDSSSTLSTAEVIASDDKTSKKKVTCLTSFSTKPSRSQTVAESPCCYSTPALPTILDDSSSTLSTAEVITSGDKTSKKKVTWFKNPRVTGQNIVASNIAPFQQMHVDFPQKFTQISDDFMVVSQRPLTKRSIKAYQNTFCPLVETSESLDDKSSLSRSLRHSFISEESSSMYNSQSLTRSLSRESIPLLPELVNEFNTDDSTSEKEKIDLDKLLGLTPR